MVTQKQKRNGTSDNTNSGEHGQDIILSGLNARTLALPRHLTTIIKNAPHDEIGHTRLEEDGMIAMLPILLKEFSLSNIDCIAMSETRVRLLPSGDHPMFLDREGYNIYFSGVVGTKRLAGVGIAVSKKWVVQSVFPINARVMYITAFTPSTPVTVFSVYAPTEPQFSNRLVEEVDVNTEIFYQTLQKAFDAIQPQFRSQVFILGDFNAQRSPCFGPI